MRVQLQGDLLPDQVHKDRKIIEMKLRVEREREFREETSLFFSLIGTIVVSYSFQLNRLRKSSIEAHIAHFYTRGSV